MAPHTYSDAVIPKTLGEYTQHGIFVLLLDDSRRGRKNAKSGLPQTGLGRLAGLKEKREKFRPLFS